MTENVQPNQMPPNPDRYRALEDVRTKWSLTPVAPPFSTHTGVLQRVLGPQGEGMLKLTTSDEELRGYDLLDWWDGQGAVAIIRRAGSALLIPYAACGTLLPLSKSQQDETATDIFLSVRADLHAPRSKPLPPNLTPLEDWFACLMTSTDERLKSYRHMAQTLLRMPCTPVPLHGDLHHDNILNFGSEGWRAIDPKGLVGNPLYDLGAYFLNPDGADLRLHIARRKSIFGQRLTAVSSHLAVNRALLAKWISVTAGLSAAWALRDGQDPTLALEVAILAASQV